MKVIVCQHGARHRYAVARILEEAGMLAALYTDSSVHSYLGRAVKPLEPVARGRLRRLLQREARGIPSHKIFSSDRPLFSRTLRPTYGLASMEVFFNECRTLSGRMMTWGKRNADCVYQMHYEFPEFLAYARQHSVMTVTDVYINPAYKRILQQKYAESLPEHRACIELSDTEEIRFAHTAALSDVLLCPSTWVAQGVRKLYPEHAQKIRICPYGSSIDYAGRLNRPSRGRVFWAGEAWTRKGLQYLAMAADELKRRYPDMDFRAAGVTAPEVTKMGRFRNITFVGKLDGERMKREFLSADVFVLPTLAEGMAGVVIEAMVAGCPVVTTRAAGIDAIENGKNGIIVREGNTEELAAAIERVYCDRGFRDSLAANTRVLATNYTMDAWKARLVNILGEL